MENNNSLLPYLKIEIIREIEKKTAWLMYFFPLSIYGVVLKSINLLTKLKKEIILDRKLINNYKPLDL